MSAGRSLLPQALLLILLSFAGHVRSADSYVAAIVEHAPISVPGQVSREQALSVVMANLDVYEQHMVNASSQGAQIIVFPEDGLFGDDKCTREEIFPYLERIPPNRMPAQPLLNPCLLAAANSSLVQGSEALVRLSCLARAFRMVVVADLGDVVPCTRLNDPYCPADGRYQYNTQIAIESDGTLLKKYHKTHLFYEPQYNYPRDPSPVTFATSFGVRFGMSVCFDLMFALPPVDLVREMGVTDVVYSTWWVNTPPDFSASQYQQAWSRTMRINLLAAGNGNGWLYSGSGIFSQGDALGVAFNPLYTPADTLVVAKVPRLDQLPTVGADVQLAPSGSSPRLLWTGEQDAAPHHLPLEPEEALEVHGASGVAEEWWAARAVGDFQIHCPMPNDTVVGVRGSEGAGGEPEMGSGWRQWMRRADVHEVKDRETNETKWVSSTHHGELSLSEPIQMSAGASKTLSASALNLTCSATLQAAASQPFTNASSPEWFVALAFVGQYDNTTFFYREHFCALFRCLTKDTCLNYLIFANTIFDGFELTANFPTGHTVFSLTSTNELALIPEPLVERGWSKEQETRSAVETPFRYTVRNKRSPFHYILLNASLLARDMRNR